MTEIAYQKSQGTFSSTDLLKGLVFAGVFGGVALGVNAPDEKVIPINTYTLSEISDTPYSVQVTKSSDIVIMNEELESAMTVFYSSLLANQEELGSDFEKVLYQNLSSLYES